jgi:isoquinoline 1-oxidoreductase alpha subunit
MIKFTLNGQTTTYRGDEGLPLLWFLRDHQGLTGTKFGCGIAQCGACTVHLNGDPRRSCVTTMAMLEGVTVTTIEGVAGPVAKAVQKAWVRLEVPQCGYCQSGQIMTAVCLLSQNQNPSDRDIDLAMNGNICRCCTYHRIRAAIHQAASELKG